MTTQEQIIENNKLIATFLGSKYMNDPYFDKEKKEMVDFWYWTKPECGYLVTVGGIELSSRWQMGVFDFHHSWDALMPVLNKIATIGKCFYELHSKYTEIQANFYDQKADMVVCYKTIYYTGSDNLQNTYSAVVDFIKVYNTYNKKKENWKPTTNHRSNKIK